MSKLWGDNYFNAKEKKWTHNELDGDGKILNRCFVEFIMNPIIKLTKVVMEGDDKKKKKMLKACKVKLDKAQK